MDRDEERRAEESGKVEEGEGESSLGAQVRLAQEEGYGGAEGGGEAGE